MGVQVSLGYIDNANVKKYAQKSRCGRLIVDYHDAQDGYCEEFSEGLDITAYMLLCDMMEMKPDGTGDCDYYVITKEQLDKAIAMTKEAIHDVSQSAVDHTNSHLLPDYTHLLDCLVRLDERVDHVTHQVAWNHSS